MGKIHAVTARQILDSRGFPTVEVDVYLESGHWGRAAVPSGASTGSYEAHERRDNDPKVYGGKGVLKACEAASGELFKAVQGMDCQDQKAIDQRLIDCDGTPHKERLGANAILALSLATARAAAAEKKMPLYRHLGGDQATLLPMPLMNVINGGAHALGGIDVQECMIVPVGAQNFPHAMQMGSEVFHALKAYLRKQGYSVAVGDEGGFAPTFPSNRAALDALVEAITLAGYVPGTDVALALDVAATELYDHGKYHLRCENRTLSSDQLIAEYDRWLACYPIVSIEDGLAEDDFEGWKALTQSQGQPVQIVGDDLFVTNVKRLEQGIQDHWANAILIKVNQIGTLTETLAAIELARQNQMNFVISHRSGETEDAFIADLAVATGAGQIKTGALSRSERICKYNQLLRIHEQLGSQARFQNPFPEVQPSAMHCIEAYS
jgi:enolase